MPVLSVIVPVYNTSDYLKDCLDSIINQSYTDIEIICVNDGSTDSSLSILKEYEKKDSRIVVIDLPKRGVGFARNSGLEIAKGEYVTFVDSDDYIEKDTYQKTMSYSNMADIVVFGIKVFGDILSDRRASDQKYYDIKYSGMLSFDEDLVRKIDCSSCNKIFVRKILVDNGIKFPDNLHYEDAEFFYKYIFNCKTLYFINEYLYNYRRRTNSIMSKTFKGCEFALDHLLIVDNLCSFLLEKGAFIRYYHLLCLIFEDYCWFSYTFSFANRKKKVFSIAYDIAKKYFNLKEKNTDFVKKVLEKKYKNLFGNRLTIAERIFSIKNQPCCMGYKRKVFCILGFKFKIKIDNTLTLLQQIFSIKNRHNHKIISLLGFKIKLKNSKLIEKNYRLELDELKKSIKSNIENIEFINKKLAETKEDEVQQNKFLFDVVSTLQELYKKTAIKEQFCIDDIFSNYAVISGITSQNLRYLFYKPEYLQEYCKITAIPSCSLIWGSAPWYPQKETIMYSLRQNIPFYRMEDGFLRSADTWCNNLVDRKYTDGISFTISDSVHYFDATRESCMEKLINDKSLIITDEQKQRARNCINKIIETHLTKYNHQPIYTPHIGREGVKKVLVVDQSYGDFSISLGLANENTFKEMLDCAIRENPDADIIVKTHPDTMTKGSQRPIGYYSGLISHDNLYLQTEPINPISLLKYVDKVYVCTTQFGFEALMCGKEVHVFGMPFYAGWGLTNDRQVCSRRTNKRSLEELFYIAYIMYSYYVNPDKKCRCEIEEAMDYLLNLREEYFSVKKDK